MQDLIDVAYFLLKPGRAIDRAKSQRYIMAEQQRLITMQQRYTKMEGQSTLDECDRAAAEFNRFL